MKTRTHATVVNEQFFSAVVAFTLETEDESPVRWSARGVAPGDVAQPLCMSYGDYEWDMETPVLTLSLPHSHVWHPESGGPPGYDVMAEAVRLLDTLNWMPTA